MRKLNSGARWGVLFSAGLVGPLGCADEGPADSAGRSVGVAVAPIKLDGIVEACYSLTVTNAPHGGGDTVWTKSNLCSTQYGDGKGSLSFVGPCDADVAGKNTVTLELTSLEDTEGPAAFKNPCGAPDTAPCSLEFTCQENADTSVVFDLTIMRPATQGFFDTVVNFEDVFCSAKLDSCNAAGVPNRLLFGPNGQDHTAVAAFSCTAGPGEQSRIVLVRPTIECSIEDGTTVLFDMDLSTADGGNETLTATSGTDSYTLHYATYFGAQQQQCEGPGATTTTCGNIYYNLALDIEALADQGPAGRKIESCRLFYGATATSATQSAFSTEGSLGDPQAVHPWVTFGGQDGTLIVEDFDPTCFTNAMDGAGSEVTTGYVKGSAFAPGPGAPAFTADYYTDGGQATTFSSGAGMRRSGNTNNTTERWACVAYGDGSNRCSCINSSNGDYFTGTIGYTWYGQRYCQGNLD